MIFHENRLLADDSHEISYLIVLKIGKMSQNLSSAAVMIGALRVNLRQRLMGELFSTPVYQWLFNCQHFQTHFPLKPLGHLKDASKTFQQMIKQMTFIVRAQ